MINAAQLKSILVANGLVAADATDEQVQAAAAAAQKSNPDAFNALLAKGTGPSMLTIIGIGAGLVAAWFLWKNYSKTKKVDAIDYPEPEDELGPRLHNMSKSLGAFRSSSFKGARRMSGCRNRSLGAHAPRKYEFEPEIRLEGYRKQKSRSRR